MSKNKGTKMSELLDEWESHKGTIFLSNLYRIETSRYIVNRNYSVLKKFINKLEDNYPMFGSRNKKKFRIAMRELLRMLHNYLSSIMSLKEHTNRFIRNLKNSELIEQFNNKKIQLFSSNCASFVKQFRNYIRARAIIETDTYRLHSVVVRNQGEAVDVTRRLVEEEGVQSILLCPGFTHRSVAEIQDAVKGKAGVFVARGDGPSSIITRKARTGR